MGWNKRKRKRTLRGYRQLRTEGEQVKRALRLSDDELRLFKMHAAWTHCAQDVRNWIRNACHEYIQIKSDPTYASAKFRKQAQLRRISSLIWGVVEKKFEEYGEIEP